MSLHSWLRNLRSALAPLRDQRRDERRAAPHRPRLEVLDDRLTPSAFAWDGTYRTEPPPGVAWASSASHLADCTGDGIPDRIDLITYNVVVRPGLGGGAFGAPIYSPCQDAITMALADFNSDGRLDVFTTNIPGFFGEAWGTVLWGGANGAFHYGEDYGLGVGLGAALHIGVGDVFNTGRTDVVVGGEVSEYDYVFAVLRNTLELPATPRLVIDPTTVTEGNAGAASATFTVRLSAASSEAITVNYATADGSATTADYQATTGTLTFAPGETSKTISVLVNGDRLGEQTDTFVVNLSNPTNATIGASQGVGTIQDDEPRISITDVTKSEGRKGQTTRFTFTVYLSAAYDEPVTMSFSTVNGTAKTSDGDYVARTGTLTFAPGETTKTITIEVKGDSKREANEYFYLDLSGNSGNSLFTKNRGTGTILNDD